MMSRLDSLEFCPTNVLDTLAQKDPNFSPSDLSFFLIDWISQNNLHFSQTQDLSNSYLPTHPLYSSKNGQEINEETAIKVIQLLNIPVQKEFDAISNIDSPSTSQSEDSPQLMAQMPSSDQKMPLMAQNQVSMNPITLAYPPQPPFGLNHYLNTVPLKLFIYPILLQNERKGAWTKGAGGLSEFLLKKMKKEMEQNDDVKKSRSKSRRRDDKKQKFYERKKDRKTSRSRDRHRRSRDRRSPSIKRRDRKNSHSSSQSRDHKRKHRSRH